MWALILDCRGHVACAHGAHMHVSRGKSFSGVPVNRLLFTAKRKTCPNWFNCKNRIIPFHLITCPLHRVQAPLLFSPQLSSPQHVMSFRLEYSKNRKKKHACWEQHVSYFIQKSFLSKRNVQPRQHKYMQMLIIITDLCSEDNGEGGLQPGQLVRAIVH